MIAFVVAVANALCIAEYRLALDENREFFVHLPEEYGADTTLRYPVLYVLDGGWQSFHSAESARPLTPVGLCALFQVNQPRPAHVDARLNSSHHPVGIGR